MNIRARSFSFRRNVQGLGMIEVLVSVLVLAVGLLGVAAMQSLALRGGQGSMETTQAVMQSNSIIEAMRSNSAANYNTGKVCSVAAVGGSDLKANDQKAWIGALQSTIGTAGDKQICGQIAGCPGACVITVFWNDSRAGGSSARTLVTNARI